MPFLLCGRQIACPTAAKVRWGVSAGLNYAYRVARVTLKAHQDYKAGYDASQNYERPVFHDGLGLHDGVNGYACIFHVNTPADLRAGYLLHHYIPGQVEGHAGGLVPLPGDHLAFWTYGGIGGDSQRFSVHSRAVESEGIVVADRSALGLNMDVDVAVHVQNFFMGAWASFVYYLGGKEDLSSVESFVRHGAAENFSGRTFPCPLESKAYEVYDFKLFSAEKVDVRWKDYARIGALIGYEVVPGLAFEFRAGARYVAASLSASNAKMYFPYAHRTYVEEAFPKERGAVKQGKIFFEGGGWAPVFSVFARVRVSEMQGVLVGVEFASAEVELKWKRSDFSGAGDVKNPYGVPAPNQMHVSSGWHMTYVDKLHFDLSARAQITEVSVCAMYNVSF